MDKTQGKDYVSESRNRCICLSIVLTLLRLCIPKFLSIGKKFDMFKAVTFFAITVKVHLLDINGVFASVFNRV
jgi:hypothetical protein